MEVKGGRHRRRENGRWRRRVCVGSGGGEEVRKERKMRREG